MRELLDSLFPLGSFASVSGMAHLGTAEVVGHNYVDGLVTLYFYNEVTGQSSEASYDPLDLRRA